MGSDDEREELSSANPTIWDDGATFSPNQTPNQTKDTKVHVTLRVDANVRRELTRYKKHNGRRTVTAAIEALLRKALTEADDREGSAHNVERTIAHNLYQDEVLAVLARSIHIESEQDRTFVETFLQNSRGFGRSSKAPR